ncbi:FecCD family ABC transporter permease [Paradevosia shaoguanensis]|uniref:Iron ABC transporter permease n=1 Tax=Paradevosia shaoguanensis TaxID=1335043 RepID=A0AA41QMS0_9HYPH|nr:iron ABC transporter permease [Paradevosia shaoguanensis]MCI0127474.1 iron ABC transporter permease [Paradevosia shaoguanensis]CDP53926.1 ABC-type Fe3+-siderophore transport system, permea se component [Devosia sp. DBB001]
MLLVAAAYASLTLGYKLYSPADIWGLLTGATGEAQIVLMQYRVPRVVIAPIVGAALGIAGVVVQTLSRNRIASPDTLGLNAGASFAVVVASAGFGVSSMLGLSAAAATGALLTALLVFAIAAGAGGLSPIRIVLIGVTIAGLFSALVEVVLTVRETMLDQLLFWLAGAVVDRPLTLVATGGPIVAIGALLAVLLAPSLDILQTDEQTARGLGVPVALVRVGCFAAIALLTGASVAMAGPVGFVGLVVPHAARSMVGLKHMHQLLAAALFGALYLTVADVVARFVIYPLEAPVGAITAVVGGCVLVVLLRRRAA